MKSTIARSSRRPLRPTFIMAGSFDAVATLPSRETRGGPAAAPLPVLLAPKVADRLADLGRVREALLGQALERRADVPARAAPLRLPDQVTPSRGVRDAVEERLHLDRVRL